MAYTLENLSVLCVDDNKYMQQIYWIFLSSMGFKKVSFEANGEEAMTLMRTNTFDLIFTDLNCSPIDGLEFVTRVRNSTGIVKPDIPIIIVSGNTTLQHVEAARDAGATEFMAKPVSAKGLYDRIRSVIESPRAFLEGESYRGPDRRRRKREVFDGSDRREEQGRENE